jgi:type IV pilus assembly protein PilV
MLMLRSRRQDGFSMLEVLISLLILSIGLLGLASLQITGLQNNQSAYLRSQATILSSDIVDTMLGNRRAATLGEYNHQSFDQAPPGGSSRAAQDLQAWWSNLNVLLPDGRGTVNVTSDGIVTIRIRWLDEREEEEEQDQRRIFEYRTEI